MGLRHRLNGREPYAGKVVTEKRYNYVVPPGGAVEAQVIVTEFLTYGGRSGRVSAKSTGINIGAMNWNQSFTWDELGNLGSESHPACTHANCTATAAGSPTQTYGYTRGLLTGIPGYATVGYHLNGLPATISHPNGVLDTIVNDAKERPRPASITTTGGSRNWPSGTYSYDAAGNIYAMGTDYFLYDSLSRITTSRLHDQPYDGGTEKKQSYSYDRYGNLLDVTTQVGTGTPVTRTNATVATTNRLSAAGYDLAANVTSWQGQSYGYDPFDSMRYGPNRVLIYGPGDERIWEFAFTNAADVGTWVETFTLRGLDGKVKREYRAAGGTGAGNWRVNRDHLYRGGEILATVLPQLGATYHYSLDHLGTPRLVTDQNAIKIAQHTYYPYGEEATSPLQDGERMKFTGHERDFQGAGTTDDLDYMHARYCSPMTGRLMSMDPVLQVERALVSPQLWNRFSYALGNPMVFRDPTGQVVNLASMEAADRQELLNQLSQITGLLLLYDEKNGTLVIGGPITTSSGEAVGSEIAREDLQTAVNSKEVFFGLGSNDSAGTNMGKQVGKHLFLDFSDIRQIDYGQNNSLTFGAGMIFLHELKHAQGMKDPKKEMRRIKPDIKGETVDHMNRIRKQLNLPLRGQYEAMTDKADRIYLPFTYGPIYLPTKVDN